MPAAVRTPRTNGSQPVVASVDGLSVEFPANGVSNVAVKGVSFDLYAGEVLGLVGESGSGKTVTSLAMMGLLDESRARVSGSFRLKEQELVGGSRHEKRAVRGAQMGMVFQDPVASLDPTMTIGGQLIETIRSHRRVTRQQARQEAIGWLERVGIVEPEAGMRRYPHEFSGGMCQRAMIAMALCSDPVLVIADEPTTALDVTVQGQILDLLRSLQEQLETTFLLISHDLAVIADCADRVAVMYRGQIVEVGTVFDVFSRPRHPYTEELLATTPYPGRPGGAETREAPTRAGPPAPNAVSTGCAFAGRCLYVEGRCLEHPIEMVSVGRHLSRCLRTHELRLRGTQDG